MSARAARRLFHWSALALCINARRVVDGLTPGRFARRAGVDRKTVLRAESGLPVTRPVRDRLCRAVGFDPAEFDLGPLPEKEKDDARR